MNKQCGGLDYTKEELEEIGKDIESQLINFKVKGKVTGIMTGPVITRFEIEPGPGVKVSRFESLADDLALTLRTASVRVISSIPGKSAVGIEIPNRNPQIVFGKEILESPKFTKDPKRIQVVLGKDIMGDAFVTDLTRTPHLLIAGQTGAGKSVCINVLLASILFSKTPDEVRMILVDPKVVELAMYKDIPHLLHPVITSPEVAVQALRWLCIEMDRRYDV
jgi:DNA segregation ATPase FtsK/SpoIIIE-like protein